jgi:hypothetical protein
MTSEERIKKKSRRNSQVFVLPKPEPIINITTKSVADPIFHIQTNPKQIPTQADEEEVKVG